MDPLAYFSETHTLREKKTVVIFSPHPDDDVICMGGTIMKLVKQGHDVHVAYMTSGSYAVFDHDAKKYLDFFETFAR
jgi:glucosamine-6-phosphate deaminase